MSALAEHLPTQSRINQTEMHDERFAHMYASSLLQIMNAEGAESRWVVEEITPEINKDPVIQEANARLAAVGDMETVWHEQRVQSAGIMAIGRILELYDTRGTGKLYNGPYAATILGTGLPQVPNEQLEALKDIWQFGLDAALHDVGKDDSAIQAVMRVKGGLNAEQQAVMAVHSDRSVEYIESSSWDERMQQESKAVVGAHHAYKVRNPHGQKVEGRLQLRAEILAFTDMADALASDKNAGRDYREKSLSRDDIINIMHRDFAGDYTDLLMLVYFGETRQPDIEPVAQRSQRSMRLGNRAMVYTAAAA